MASAEVADAAPELLTMTLEEIDAYIAKLQEEFKFEYALKVINDTLADKKCLETHSTHYEHLLLHAASCNIELKTEDSQANAKSLLDKAIELKPDTGFLKFLSYAQLLKGSGSIAKYQKALDILKKEIDSLVNEKVELKQKLSEEQPSKNSAGGNRLQRRKKLNAVVARIKELESINQGCHTAMGEVYLTDLQDDPNSLSLAAFHGKAAKLAAKSTPVETRLLLVHIKSLETINAENVEALNEAKLEMREIALEFEHCGCDIDPILLKKCIMAALSIECFVESHSMILIMEEMMGLNNVDSVAVWAAYHRSLAVYHLKGFHHYSPRLIQIIEGLENANESTDSVKDTKTWIDELVGTTVQAITTGEDSDGGMDFEEKSTNESFYHRLETKYDLEETNPEVIVLSDNEAKKEESARGNSITLDSSSDDESIRIVETEPKLTNTTETAQIEENVDNDCQILNGDDEASTANPNIT